MAISVTVLASGAIDLPSGGGDTTWALPATNVTAGDLICVLIHGNIWSAANGLPTAIDGITGLSLTSRVAVSSIDTYSAISAWTGVAGSTVSGGNLTVTIPSGGWDGFVYSVLRIDGVKTTGTNGSDAIRQSQTSTGTNPRSATLASAMLSGNRAIAFGGAFRYDLTPETSTSDYSTEIFDSGVALDDTGSYSMWAAAYLSADHTDLTPTITASNGDAFQYGILVFELDAVPGGTSLTGQSASLSMNHGSLTVAAEYPVIGRTANVAVALGSLGMIPSAGLSGQTLGILCQLGIISHQVSQSIVASQSGVVAQDGDLQTSVDGLSLTGGSASIGAFHGLIPTTGNLTGQQVGIAVTTGQLGVSSDRSMSGSSVAINVAHGSFGSGTDLDGEVVGIAVQSGTVGHGAASEITGSSASINVSHGSFGAGGTDLSGSVRTITVSHGSLGAPLDQFELSGGSLSIAMESGDLGESGTSGIVGYGVGISVSHGSFQSPDAVVSVDGRAAGISVSIGSVSSPGGSTLNGQFVGISVTVGQVGDSTALALNGGAVGIQTQSGNLGPEQSVSLLGGSLGISLAGGAVGSGGGGDSSLPGLALGVSVSHGSVGQVSQPELSGSELSIQVAHGSPQSTTALPGRFLGISMAHGSLGESGDSTSQLGSLPVTIQTAVGSIGATAQENMPSLRARIGANQLPGNPALRNGKGVYTVTDMSLVVLLDLLSAAIRAECGAMYEDVTGESECVLLKIPFDILDWDNLMKFSYPLLSVHSEGQGSYAVEIGLDVKLLTYTVRYVLPPMGPERFVELNGFLNLVDNAIRAAIAVGYHPDYENGVQALVGEDSIAKMYGIKVSASRRGRLHFATEIHQFLLEVKFDVEEIIGPNPNLTQTLVPLQGIDGHQELGEVGDSLPIVDWTINYS